MISSGPRKTGSDDAVARSPLRFIHVPTENSRLRLCFLQPVGQLSVLGVLCPRSAAEQHVQRLLKKGKAASINLLLCHRKASRKVIWDRQ